MSVRDRLLQLARRNERLIRAFPPAQVTSRERSQEVDPQQGGLEQEDVEAIWASVEDLYRERLHPAIALCVRRRGAVVLDRAIGHLAGNSPDDPLDAPLVQAHPDSLFNVFSASKAITAMVIHLLDERRQLHLDDPVAEYLPAFGQRGKQDITIRHLLTHRAGIPNLPTEHIDLALLAQPERIAELLCGSAPNNRAGRRLAYHALTSGWVLGALVKSVTGQEIGQVLRQEILDPLGIQHMDYGVREEDIPRVAQHALTGPPIVAPFAGLLRRALGVPFEDAVRFSNDPRFLQATVPAGNVIGTAEEVSRFFEMLLRGGALGDARVFERRTIARATAEQEYLSVDATFGIPVRYSMGFVLGGKVASLYGPDTEQAFGHLGFTTVTAWADPERDLSACLMTSGKHFLTLGLWPHLKVLRTLNQRCPKQRG